MTHLNENLISGDTRKTRLLLRFITELMNNHVITFNSYSELMDSLVNHAINNNSVVGYMEWVFYIVLCAIPFVYIYNFIIFVCFIFFFLLFFFFLSFIMFFFSLSISISLSFIFFPFFYYLFLLCSVAVNILKIIFP